MSRALVTYGVGPHRELLEVALPSFREYADRHGYELIAGRSGADGFPRPLPWLKVLLLRTLLAKHDEVLWLDADVVIVDGREDIADLVPEDKWHGLAIHESADGTHPNTGVWLVRKPMCEVLTEMWRMDEYVFHRWWEQAALLKLLGFDPSVVPVVLKERTPLWHQTEFLDSAWNALPELVRDRPRFRHAARDYPDRLELMTGWAQDARFIALLAMPTCSVAYDGRIESSF